MSGSLVRLGNDFSVNIELSNTQTDEVEWTMKSDRKPLEEIFEVQQEIAEETSGTVADKSESKADSDKDQKVESKSEDKKADSKKKLTEGGYIVRTVAEGVSKEEIKKVNREIDQVFDPPAHR